MEPERDEVYERIPWETLEKQRNDRQWLVYAVAGAVVLGALAYSFMRNQPTAAPPPETVAASTVPATTALSHIDSTPSTVTSPVVVAEADLYAVDPERRIDQAAGHAEWFAVEYVAVDGSEASRETLRSLLPGGLPLPEAPEGTQVFVDWARARSVTQTGSVSYQVQVMVRSLVSSGESGFLRQPTLLIGVEVEIGDDDRPAVVSAPTVDQLDAGPEVDLGLTDVPEEVRAQVADRGEVVGGIQGEDGSWEVVVMAEGSDGVTRPVAVRP